MSGRRRVWLSRDLWSVEIGGSNPSVQTIITGVIMKAVIFDLDGTLCDITHRLHHIQNGKRDYDQFFKDCSKDTPKPMVIKLMQDFVSLGYAVLICSGRSDVVREETAEWLDKYGAKYHHQLLMRKEGDHTPDDKLKSEMLDLIYDMGYEVQYVVEDRQRVVDMWRSRGLTTLQIDQWEED